MKNQSYVWDAVGISLLMEPEVQGRIWWEMRPERAAGPRQAGLGSQAQEFGLCSDVFREPLANFK